jgi:3-deoxy-D-manno-octulosonic-acid transferase
MGLCYSFLIAIYNLLLKFAALWHPKAKALVSGRKETWALLQKLPKTGSKRYWFHCASLGEYDMALPLIQACLVANPALEIVVSFYSPSGIQHYHKRGFEPHAVFYLPADNPRHMQRLINVVKADRLYLLKYEFWPNLLQKAQEAGLKVYGVSTILRPSQVYFKWYGGFFRRALKRVAHFAVQNEATQKRLLALGISSQKIEILGDLRFNRVLEAKASAQPNPIIAQFVGNSPLLILGSSWPQEEKILFDFLDSHNEIMNTLNLKVLIAPHDLSTRHLTQLGMTFPQAVIYSKMKEASFSEASLMILDTIGHLSAAYQYGSVAFVGGGFSGSLHNILEPLAYGLPVMFGPKHEKFPEAQQFIDLGFAQVVSDEQDFETLLETSLQIAKNTKSVIETQVFNLQGKISTLLIG